MLSHGDHFQASAERIFNANATARLPHKFGGFGHTTVEDIAAASYLASVLSVRNDDAFKLTCDGLDEHTKSAHADICTRVGCPSPIPAGAPLASHLPTTADDMVTFNPREFSKPTTRSRGLQKALSSLIRAQQRDEVRLEAADESTNKDEATRALSITSRSQATRVLSCSLWWRRFRIPRIAFIGWARYYLALPPLRYGRPTRAATASDCPQADCPYCTHRNVANPPTLDSYGNHAVACNSGSAGHHAAHRTMQAALQDDSDVWV